MERGEVKKLAILSYHKIGPPPEGGWESWYYVSGEMFAEHLRLLKARGYEAIDITAFYRGLDEPSTLPAKSTLITFDDGYRNNLTVALPVMKQLRVPGVIFVPTQYIGGINGWDTDNEPLERICDWDELLELERGGVAVESHSVSHPSFSLLTPAQQEDELRRSKETLEAGLGRAVGFLGYPYGDAGTDAAFSEAALHRIGYRAACLYRAGLGSRGIAR
jgi:peptidoglycan/xylan/chitin deacetylase (PgdA/CDA1 family)